MNPGLKRIEATLDQLNTQSGSTEANAAVSNPAKTRKKATEAKARSLQPFPLPAKSSAPPIVEPVPAPSIPAPLPAPAPPASAPTAKKAAKKAAKAKRSTPPPDTVKPFPTQEQGATPALPKAKPPSISSLRHAANPNLALGMLKEIEGTVSGWKQDLEQIIQQIQAIYEEGPIVDGWLESHHYEPQFAFQSIGAATLRHAEIEHLMEYVEQICQVQPSNAPSEEEPSRTGYRLCGLDADGQLWSRPCPPSQVPYVGLAIARYQKLRILLGKKQTLENRLHHLVQTLTILHAQLHDSP